MTQTNQQRRSALLKTLKSLNSKDKNVNELIKLLEPYEGKNAARCKELIQTPSVQAAIKTAEERTNTRLIKQIGDYNLSEKDKSLSHDLLGKQALQLLYETEYKDIKPNEKEPKLHREAFVKFLLEREKDVEKMDTLKRDEFIATGTPEEAAITMETLLTSEGVRLYKLALEEERNSKEYLDAVFAKSTTHFEGTKWKNPAALSIGGPSGCGKSYYQRYLVEKLAADFEKIESDESGNNIISIDGGNAREVSQIRKLVIQMANKREYTFISDLASKSTILDRVARENVKKAASKGKNRQPLNIVIPDTFSKLGAVSKASDKISMKLARDYYRELSSKYGSHVYEARIVGINGAPAPDPDVVRFKGVARSAKTDFTQPMDDYDLNINPSLICESKAYSAGVGGTAFSFGVEGSRKIENQYKELFPNGRYIHVEYDLILIGKEDDIWEKRDQSKEYEKVRAVSSQLFEDWESKKQTEKNLTFEAYEKMHEASIKPRIKEYKCSEKTRSVQDNFQFEDASRVRTKNIIKEAEKQIIDNIDSLCFDPQGRVLTKVRSDGFNRSTTVSYDITNDIAINHKFLQKIEDNITDKIINKDVSQAYNSLNTKSSIIPLQQEFHFHLRLALQVYKAQIAPLLSDDEFETIHLNTMKKVNSLVMKAFADGLVKSYTKGEINIPQLNKALDDARGTILPEAHKILCQQFKQKADLKEPLSKDTIENLQYSAEMATATSDSLLHLDNKMGLATHISGTDVSSHDRDFGVEHLADMQTIAYKYSPKTDDLQDIPNSRTQVRVPSIAVKDLKKLASGKVDIYILPWIETGYIGERIEPRCQDDDFKRAIKSVSMINKTDTSRFIKDQNGKSFYFKDGDKYKKLSSAQVRDLLKRLMILDARDKISHLSERYFVPNFEKNDSSLDSIRPNAFIYNLYTSLNSGASGNYDESRNFQNESLELILRGAHQYNKTIARGEDKKTPLCFVQAIAVNGYGNNLGYSKPLLSRETKPQTALREEATLMTEMALLHTLSEYINEQPALTKKIKSLFDIYNEFLKGDKPWFSRHNSAQAIGLIAEIKNDLKDHPLPKNVPLTAQCLAKMFAHDKHFTNEARLIQALSVVTEKNSMSGCKSANERTQVVNSRVALFDSENEELKELMVQSMNIFLDKDNNIDKAFNDFERAVDSACNDHNLYGEYSLISLQSQGASYKAETGEWYDMNTNKIEASAAVMKNHNQANAAEMQAHKGLVNSMVKAIKETSGEKTWKDKLKSNRWLGATIIFSMLAILTVICIAFPALIPLVVGGTLVILSATSGGIGLGFGLRHFWNKHQENLDEEISNETDDLLCSTPSSSSDKIMKGMMPAGSVTTPVVAPVVAETKSAVKTKSAVETSNDNDDIDKNTPASP